MTPCQHYRTDGTGGHVPSCAIGEPDGRHCGPGQYPRTPCNLDAIGRGEPWRSIVGFYIHSKPWPPIIRTPVMGAGCNWIAGWSP